MEFKNWSMIPANKSLQPKGSSSGMELKCVLIQHSEGATKNGNEHEHNSGQNLIFVH
jgi:hypothetical protein